MRQRLSAPTSTLLVAVALATGVACDRRSGESGVGPGGGVDAGAFDKRALLGAFGACAFDTAKAFEVAAADLANALSSYAADPSAANAEAARASWRSAMSVWQRAEAMQFGPAAKAGSPGGQSIRDEINVWPLTGRCLVDSQLVAKGYETPGLDGALVSTKGLPAIEYLLFYEPTDNGCPATNAINTQGTWAALGDAEVRARRVAYARAAADDVKKRATQLREAWDPAAGNFVATLEMAGDNDVFATQQMGLNAVSDAMFYLDIVVKNAKVGKPAGLTPDCLEASCPDAVESLWAGHSKQNIASNIEGYKALYAGCAPGGDLGFDDLLVAVGANETKARIDGSIQEIDAALAALSEPTLRADIEKNPAGVRRLFDALRANATLMKSEMATVLDLELPQVVEGDND